MTLLRTTFILLLCISGLPIVVSAADYAVSPLVIEHETEARDIISETITITNFSSRQARIYATVNAVTLGDEGAIETFVQPSEVDRSVTVTSWIEVSRGRIEVPGGESVQVPITFRVSPNAEPGEYHAFVGFGSGSKRDDVEARAVQGLVPGVIVRLSIPENRNEYLQLKSFSIDRIVADTEAAQVGYTLFNSGDMPQQPTGRVLFYNARGQEVGEISINTNGTTIAPGEEVYFEESLPDSADWGRHKAFLEVAYGNNQRATVYDTTFFHIVPLRLLITIFIVVLISSMLVAYYIHRRGVADDDDDEDRVLVRVGSGVAIEEKDHDINLRQ